MPLNKKPKLMIYFFKTDKWKYDGIAQYGGNQSWNSLAKIKFDS